MGFTVSTMPSHWGRIVKGLNLECVVRFIVEAEFRDMHNIAIASPSTSQRTIDAKLGESFPSHIERLGIGHIREPNCAGSFAADHLEAAIVSSPNLDSLCDRTQRHKSIGFRLVRSRSFYCPSQQTQKLGHPSTSDCRHREAIELCGLVALGHIGARTNAHPRTVQHVGAVTL